MLSARRSGSRCAYAITALAFSSTLSAQVPKDPDMAAVDSLIVRTQRTTRAPGITVAVARDRRIVYSRSFGLSDVENDVRATAASEYRTASVAKPFTATAVLSLVETHKLELDRSIRDYVTELPATFDSVTVRDLLRHTGGVRHYRNDAEFVTTRHCDSLTQALAIFASDPLEHRPGERITYSSWGYVLLGLAVERASGMRYADYVRKAIFVPAQMTATRLDNVTIIPHRARGYRRTGKDNMLVNAPPVDLSCRVPAGGFVSTSEDLVRFASALNAGELVSRQSVQEMMRSQLSAEVVARTLAVLKAPAGFKPPGLGFGWAVEPDGSAVYHGGNQPGFTSMLYDVPSKHLSVAIMTNLEGVGDELTELARGIAAAMVRERIRDHGHPRRPATRMRAAHPTGLTSRRMRIAQ